MQSRQALDAPHKYTLQAFNMVYGVHCWPRVATWYAPHVFSVWWLRKRMLEDVPPMTDIEFLDTRADVRRPPLILDAAWHFTRRARRASCSASSRRGGTPICSWSLPTRARSTSGGWSAAKGSASRPEAPV